MFIARALQRTQGNLCDAAEMLGVHRNTISRKIAEYRIKRSA
jgi:DNA-binding NtrC family response regulator